MPPLAQVHQHSCEHRGKSGLPQELHQENRVPLDPTQNAGNQCQLLYQGKKSHPVLCGANSTDASTAKPMANNVRLIEPSHCISDRKEMRAKKPSASTRFLRAASRRLSRPAPLVSGAGCPRPAAPVSGACCCPGAVSRAVAASGHSATCRANSS
jgi:hypothetical protein